MTAVAICNAALSLLGAERIERLTLTAEEIEEGLELEDLEATCSDVYPGHAGRDDRLLPLELEHGAASAGGRPRTIPASRSLSGTSGPWASWRRERFARSTPAATRTTRRGWTGWTRQGPFLYTEFRSAWVDRLRDVNEAIFPKLFRSALTLQLAAVLAPSVAYDVQIGAFFQRRADVALKEAKRQDGQGTPTKGVSRFSYIEARFGRFAPRGADRFDWSNPNPPGG